ncbi:MAG: hypothetical protein GPOALKHO_000804 [Sodalis sp.]|nr:MAG: hypothetical protein GPOALKHO_000804 [Sodalis sp.]
MSTLTAGSVGSGWCAASRVAVAGKIMMDSVLTDACNFAVMEVINITYLGDLSFTTSA